MTKLVEFIRDVFAGLERNRWLPPLVARLALAGEFIPSGFGKVMHPDKLIAEFVHLGIPAPKLMAAASSTTELVCGVLLLVGLATRFAAAALTVVMTVAIFTARRNDAHTLGDFFYLPEVLYIVLFVWLIFAGAGSLSVDHWAGKKNASMTSQRRRRNEPPWPDTQLSSGV